MAEFTGERVIPGEVDRDLWNEHFARYAFAARLSRNKSVLDLGCGSGYGTSHLAAFARFAGGVDISPDAIHYATANYASQNIAFAQAGCTALPFRNASFDLVVAFEVIEHMTDWRTLLAEVRRVLRPSGQFIVSTPNRLYYTESRGPSGANPFHEHEFEYAEFRTELGAIFPHVALFLQNQTGALLFQPAESWEHDRPVDVRAEQSSPDPDSANFFVAVCAMAPQTGAPTFIYVPSSANVLRERELHIRRLEGELATKDQWLAEARNEHQELLGLFRKQTADLEQRNAHIEDLDKRLNQAWQRVKDVQDELVAEQREAAKVVAAYDEKIAELELINQQKTEWAIETERRLSAELAQRVDELGKCVEALHNTESILDERTNWALDLQKKIAELELQLSGVRASRWFRLGRTLGLGPELRQ